MYVIQAHLLRGTERQARDCTYDEFGLICEGFEDIVTNKRYRQKVAKFILRSY